MRFVFTVVRYLLGLVFTFFGLNGFLHFLSMQPLPGLAGQFIGALVQSRYIDVVFAFEIAGGVLLLANRYIPLALTLLAPVIFNILLFHVTMAPAGLFMAIVVSVLWLTLAYSVRRAFGGIVESSATLRAERTIRPSGAATVDA